MNLHKFSFQVFLVGGLFNLSVFCFIFSVDPYGLMPGGLLVEGWNDLKIARNVNRGRLIKAYDLLKIEPEIVVFGTSRILETVDPEALSPKLSGRVYNAGIRAARPQEYLDMFRQALERGVKIKKAIFEIYLWRLFDFIHNRGDAHIYQRHKDYFTLYYSVEALRDSFRTIWENLFNRDAIPRQSFLRPNGFSNYTTPKTSLTKNLAHWEDTQLLSGVDYTFPESARIQFKKIMALCDSYEVECKFAITPAHPYRLAFHQQVKMFHFYDSVKKAMVKIGPTYDFTRLNPLTWHHLCEPTNGWFDRIHFTPSVGNAIVSRLLSERSGPPPDSFGVRLEENNIDAFLMSWHQEIAEWTSKNPEFIRPRPDRKFKYVCQ